jgi:hypothetical protein
MMKFRFTVAAVLLGWVAILPVQAQTTTSMNGQSITIAMKATVLENGDEKMFLTEKKNLMASVRLSSTPLPYTTTASIPDARKVGYGDCKSMSIAFRNIFVIRCCLH